MTTPEYMRTDPTREAMRVLQSRVKGLYVLTVIILAVVICASIGIGISMRRSSTHRTETTWTAEQQRALAVSLQTQGLTLQSADAFKDYLSRFDVPASERASVCYSMGKMYFDQQSYEESLVYFSQAELADPTAAFIPDIGRLKVTCLERLGRSADAQYALKKQTALDPTTVPPSKRADVVARIGSEEITVGDIHDELQQFPPQQQKQFSTPEMKSELLKQIIIRRLLADKGRKLGYDREAAFISQRTKIEDGLLAQKVLAEEVAGKVVIDESDVKLYYEAHKNEFSKQQSVLLSCISFASETNAARTAQLLQENPGDYSALKQKADSQKRLVTARAFANGYIPGLGSHPAAIAAAFDQKEGILATIIKTTRGYAIVHIDEYSPESVQPYDAVKQDAEARYRQLKQQEMLERMIDDLYTVNNVKLFTDRLADDSPAATGTPTGNAGKKR